MSNEEVQGFFDKRKIKEEKEIKIVFKKRAVLYGTFVVGKDYAELKSKNFWRIVSSLHLEEWKQSGDINLSKIFSGSAFQKLAIKEA